MITGCVELQNIDILDVILCNTLSLKKGKYYCGDYKRNCSNQHPSKKQGMSKFSNFTPFMKKFMI